VSVHKDDIYLSPIQGFCNMLIHNPVLRTGLMLNAHFGAYMKKHRYYGRSN